MRIEFPLAPPLAARLLVLARMRVAEFDENQPRDEDGKWTDGGASLTPNLEAIKSLLPEAIANAKYGTGGRAEDWDDLSDSMKNDTYAVWSENASENMDIDTSDIDAEVKKELQENNEEIVAETEKGVEQILSGRFPNENPVLPYSEGYTQFRQIDVETLTYEEDDPTTLADLDELAFKDGTPLTPEEQQIVAETWDRIYRDNFDDALQKEFESDSYYEQRDQLVSDSLSEQWDSLSDSEKFDIYSSGHELPERPVSAGEPDRWVTGIIEGEGTTEDQGRTRAIALELAARRTDQILAERGIKSPPGGSRALSDSVWGDWKNSSSNDNSLAFQIATARELGGVHRIEESEAKRIVDDTGTVEMARLQAYARAQWETTQFVMAQAGQENVQVYRGLMLPLDQVNAQRTELVPSNPGYTDMSEKLPDIALKRAGLQSTTSDPGVANGWGGVGISSIAPHTRVVLRVEAPRTSVISIPVFGQNVHEEKEIVLIGTRERWSWDAWRNRAPEIAKVPIVKETPKIKAAAAKLTIDLQALDAGQPHWLSKQHKARWKARLRGLEFNPDQPRDDHGRWTDTGSEWRSKSSSEFTPSRQGGLDTRERFSDGHGRYTPERAALHQEIVQFYLKGTTRVEHPVATILGGGPASGKSTIVAMDNIGGENTVDVNVDLIREHLPEYKEGVKAGDKTASSFTHEESSDIAKEIIAQSVNGGRNLVLDGTGDSSIEKLGGKVARMRAGGHEVVGRYVTISTDEAVRRAMTRAFATGRYVPEDYIRDTHAAISRVFPEAIRQGLFDRAELHDNSGSKPVKVASSIGRNLVVHDDELWRNFLDKGNAAH